MKIYVLAHCCGSGNYTPIVDKNINKLFDKLDECIKLSRKQCSNVDDNGYKYGDIKVTLDYPSDDTFDEFEITEHEV